MDLYFAQVASSRFAVPRTLFSVESRRAVGLAAIACERYRLENGRFPARLQSLVPEYLPDVPIDPIDPIDGRHLRYRLEDDGSATIYSIFTNQKDDGGTTDFEDWLAVLEGDYVWKLKAPSE